MQFQPGHAKLGGRIKGTPNKETSVTRAAISSLLSQYVASGQIDKDFATLDPRERITIAERLFQYCVPKMQATAVDITEQSRSTIADRLRALAEEPNN